jgi:hypothetical protein
MEDPMHALRQMVITAFDATRDARLFCANNTPGISDATQDLYEAERAIARVVNGIGRPDSILHVSGKTSVTQR